MPPSKKSCSKATGSRESTRWTSNRTSACCRKRATIGKFKRKQADELLAESEPAWFETAKQSGSWTAQWITPGEDQAAQPIVKKQFVLEKEVVAARLYICGLGLYEFEMNGQRTHDEYLLPGYHAYDFWQQYQTFDVTDSLKSGGNALGILLGDGWYKGRFGFDGGYTNLYGDQLKLIAELHLDLRGRNNRNHRQR